MFVMTKRQAGILGYIASVETLKHLELERHKKYDTEPVLCRACKCALPYKKRRYKFCDHSCAASVTNLGTVRNGIARQTVPCLNCGIDTQNPLYCSGKCKAAKQKLETVQRWLVGLTKACDSAGHMRPTIRNWIIANADGKCSECGWDKRNPISGRLTVQVDHRDGNSLNDRPENLRVLCPNCHSLTSTYMALNLGNGRENRRKRYAAGLSQ